jgi:hypothetical protein
MVIDEEIWISRDFRMRRSTELWAMYATRIGIIQDLIIQHSESENSRPLAQEEYETFRNKISIRTEIW